jgi:hypothetical protein
LSGRSYVCPCTFFGDYYDSAFPIVIRITRNNFTLHNGFRRRRRTELAQTSRRAANGDLHQDVPGVVMQDSQEVTLDVKTDWLPLKITPLKF